MHRQANNDFADHGVGNDGIMSQPIGQQLDESLSDEAIVERIKNGERPSFELLMRRYNQRIFRIVRSIVVDENEAEDVVQEAYVRAFENLGQFTGRAHFSTWLTKIAIYEALARRRKQNRLKLFDSNDLDCEPMSKNISGKNGIVDQVSNNELGVVLAAVVDQLPDKERLVFTLRLIEEMSTRETAECLELTETNVKIRLHRARQLLRKEIEDRIGSEVRMLFQFAGVRCDRIVERVLERVESCERQQI